MLDKNLNIYFNKQKMKIQVLIQEKDLGIIKLFAYTSPIKTDPYKFFSIDSMGFTYAKALEMKKCYCTWFA